MPDRDDVPGGVAIAAICLVGALVIILSIILWNAVAG